ncbi:hypothetical protein ACFFHB_06960, partial [Chromohalobacter canadensis]
NHHIPQKALHHQSPIAMMKEWQTKRPELFTKRVVNHTGPDTYFQCGLAFVVVGLIPVHSLHRAGFRGVVKAPGQRDADQGHDCKISCARKFPDTHGASLPDVAGLAG